MKRISFLLFLVLPALFLIIGWMFSNEIGFYHLFVTDPEYAYLFNGLNILHFKLPDQVNGPGTPLQVYCAAVTKIVHIFRGQDTLVADVFKNPDVYLNIINKSIIVITFITLFLVGYFVKLATGSIFSGLFVQLMPFNTWQFFDLMRRIMVENFVIIGVFSLVIIMFLYIYRKKETSKIADFYVIAFSLIIGFIAASKLMYLPIAIIPFLLLEGGKKKLMYTLLSILAFCIFAYAIFGNWVSFRDWYLNNLIHSGQYGSGEASFIDPVSFKANFKAIFSQDNFYLKGFIFVIVGSLVYPILPSIFRKKDDKEYYALLGIAITVVVMTLLVAKQMKYYYMTTAILLLIPGIYFVIRILIRPLKNYYKLLVILPVALIVLYLSYKETKATFIYHKNGAARLDIHLSAMREVNEKFGNNPVLIIPNYYGAPYKEYGLFFGIAWCGSEMANVYAKDLRILYPDTYIHHGWNNLFNRWGESFSYIDLLKKYRKIILYSGDIPLEKTLSSKLFGVNRQRDTKISSLTNFESIGARVYEVEYDTNAVKMPFEITCNSETLDSTGTHFVDSDGLRFGNGETRTEEKSRSGSYSVKLSRGQVYGYTCELSEVKYGEKYEISVWRHKNGNTNAGIALMTPNPDVFYVFHSEAEDQGEWSKIMIEFEVPSNIHNMDLRIYCWNPDEESVVYFDDFSIEKAADGI